jgi:hypothetical protein
MRTTNREFISPGAIGARILKITPFIVKLARREVMRYKRSGYEKLKKFDRISRMNRIEKPATPPLNPVNPVHPVEIPVAVSQARAGLTWRGAPDLEHDGRCGINSSETSAGRG